MLSELVIKLSKTKSTFFATNNPITRMIAVVGKLMGDDTRG